MEVFGEVQAQLEAVLAQRETDREFVDTYLQKHGPDGLIGARDDAGRMVIGPSPERLSMRPVEVPDFMAGPQITLFGPPDDPKMSINAMNALHRQLPGEDPLVARLVRESGHVPRWGADSEDSKTPMARDLRMASRNLKGCLMARFRTMIPGMGSTTASPRTDWRCR